jgi:hypothetical protein
MEMYLDPYEISSMNTVYLQTKYMKGSRQQITCRRQQTKYMLDIRFWCLTI